MKKRRFVLGTAHGIKTTELSSKNHEEIEVTWMKKYCFDLGAAQWHRNQGTIILRCHQNPAI